MQLEDKMQSGQKQKQKQLIHIDKIILNNFKSYKGEKILGPLDQNMTSVVGPNGSGKSNLIESLLFVFGKKVQWMRLKKLSQLIHNSGSEIINEASVEVIFKEDQQSISVKRIVYSNNTTKYILNTKEVTQKVVVEFLKKKGIDLDNNRFLILQGEVEQISLMKPKGTNENDQGFLEYLEDIIGSDRWKQQIEEIEKEYQELLNQRRETNELLSVAQAEMNKLESAKNEALQFVSKEKQLFQMQNINAQINRNESNKNLIKYETQYKEQAKQMKEQQIKYSTVNTEFQKMTIKLKKINEMFERVKKEQKKIQGIIDQKEVDDKSLKQQMSQNIKKMQSLSNTLKEYTKQQVLIKQKLDQIMIEMPEVMKQNDLLNEQREKQEILLQQIEDSMNEKVKVIKQEKNNLKLQYDNINDNMEMKEKQLMEIQSQLEQISNDQNNGDLQEINEKLQKQILEKQQQDKLLNNLDDALKNINQIIKGKQKGLQNKNNQQNEVQQQLQKYEQELYYLNSSNDQNNQTRNNRNLDKLLEAQNKGLLNGIIGRLGDMGIIDRKYDVAISTCAPGLNNILTDTYENAQKAIQFLRKNQLGKVTFNPMEQMMKNYGEICKRAYNAPYNSQRLYDLIKMKDEKYCAAFYNVVRDTLVVENIDIATQIGYQQRKRVITINGELIENSGLMSGGGRKKQGLMGQQFIKNDNNVDNNKQIIQLKQSIQSLQVQLNQLNNGISLDNEELQQVQKDEYKLKQQCNLDKQKNHQQKEQISILEKQISQIQQKQDNNIIENLITEQKDLKKQINKIQKDKQPIHQKIQQFQNKINKIGGDSYIQQKNNVDEIQTKCKEMEQNLQEFRIQYNQLKKSKEVIDKEFIDKSQLLEEYKEKQNNYQIKINDLEEEVEQLMNQEIQYEEEVSSLNKNQQDLNEEQNIYKQQNDQLLNSLEENKKSLQNIKLNLDENKKKYQQYCDIINMIRIKYRNILDEYDFLNENDLTLQDDQYNVQMNQSMNNSFINQSIIENEDKKKQCIDLYNEIIFKYQYEDDILQEELNILMESSIRQMLDVNIVFQEQQLEKIQPNLKAIQEYKERLMQYKERKNNKEQMQKKIDIKRQKNDELRKQRYEEFIKGFNIINSKLKETYQLLTETGDAELELLDSLDPFSEGVVFSVRPPKKSWKQMMKLSGGEKTLSSLAFIFALHHYKPTPIYFMDEIDAALDFKNVEIVAKYLKERTKNAQFIIISLRNHMFERADRLIGIYKTYDNTKTIMYQPNNNQLSQNTSTQRKQKVN